jgi:hypothetical protein
MDMSKMMPLWFAASIFLGFLSATLGIYTARGLAALCKIIFEGLTTPRPAAKPSCWRHITTEVYK